LDRVVNADATPTAVSLGHPHSRAQHRCVVYNGP